jgi:alkyl hydroperoxide reductase subunit F
MLDANLKSQLGTYFERITQPISLTASIDTGIKSQEMVDLLTEIAGLSDKITLSTNGAADRKPSFEIRSTRSDNAVSFGGLPMGHEFNSLILALLHMGGHAPKEEAAILDRIRAINEPLNFETYFSQSCQNCPDVVQALNLLAALNPKVQHIAIDGAVFPEEVEARGILAVPSVYLNGELFGQGRMSLDQILAKLGAIGNTNDADSLNTRDIFDVLIVGGGPAGAAAAIYSARKGISTGILAERFGGQLMDTLGIENLISVPHTEGPNLASALEQQVRAHDVDVIGSQEAVKLLPPTDQTAYAEIRLASGTSLKARSIILSTGARWRQMNVPGEDTYRNKGVAYCPHCDGPLFKGKRVAVIGGGNSGVEAAIDLAGIVSHVTLIEFDNVLRADAVLQSRLRSLANVTVITSAQTTEVLGDGKRVNGLTYRDRSTGELHQIELEGIFVQIGLIPNTDWLKGTLALSPRGEIEVDERGQTSIPGVFAAGDVTTAPYKQIVISMGDGAKAALSAFDYLIRQQPVTLEKAA